MEQKKLSWKCQMIQKTSGEEGPQKKSESEKKEKEARKAKDDKEREERLEILRVGIARRWEERQAEQAAKKKREEEERERKKLCNENKYKWTTMLQNVTNSNRISILGIDLSRLT